MNYYLIPEKKSIGRFGYIPDEGFSPFVDGLIFGGDANFKAMFQTVRSRGSETKWLETAAEVREMSTTAKIILEIYTANWPKEAASFRVFPGYRPPAYDGEEEILPDISTLAPVYEGTAAKSILQVIPVTEEQVKAGFFGSMSVAYYDAEGSQLDTGELIKLYRNSEGGSGGGGGGNGAIWPVDVFQVILVILGIIMTRYFLCPEPKKERKDHL